LHENGFEDWDTVLDITEEDLDSLGFKRGHRRVLQKEIANARGSPSSPSIDGTRYSSSTPGGVTPVLTTQESFEKRTKRRYRWHPRADPNAPKKPKTAYVNFADHLRSDSSIASLSFVDIAREVGKRWQTLDPTIKQEWENRAAQAMQAYEDQMDAYRLTKQHQDYQEYLETFKKAPGKSARQKMKSGSNSSITSPRRSESSGPERSPSASNSPTLSSIDHVYQDECKSSISAALAELSQYRRERPSEQPFSAHDLPPDTLCRHAIASLIEGGSTIFHLVSIHEAETLLHRVYRLPGTADLLSIAELCVITAVGSQFARGSISSDVRKRLFGTVCSLMEQAVALDVQHLRLMRMFACLAMYSITEKSLSARSFISAGLSIAKLKHSAMSADGSREDWMKIYRTLVFLECWVSQTLASTPRNLDVHVRNVGEHTPNDRSIENVIQWHAVRIAIIGNEIATALRPASSASPDTLRYLATQLDRWQRDLPHEMQLSSLLSSPNGANMGQHNQQALLIAHIFYLGAVISLYGQPLVVAEQTGRGLDNSELAQHRSTCLVAGEQISRLMHAVNGSQAWSPRSWTVIYWAFSACNVLLLGAAQALRSRSTNDYDRLFSHSSSCLATLEACAKDEPVAARYLDTTAPIYASLKRLRESPHIDMKRRKSESKIRINDLLASDDASPTSTSRLSRWSMIDEELPGVIREVTDLLKEPFGRVSPQLGVKDPYPTPPTGPELLGWFRT